MIWTLLQPLPDLPFSPYEECSVDERVRTFEYGLGVVQYWMRTFKVQYGQQALSVRWKSFERWKIWFDKPPCGANRGVKLVLIFHKEQVHSRWIWDTFSRFELGRILHTPNTFSYCYGYQHITLQNHIPRTVWGEQNWSLKIFLRRKILSNWELVDKLTWRQLFTCYPHDLRKCWAITSSKT